MNEEEILNNKDFFVNVSKINPYKLYDVLKKEMSFDNMIILFKLMKHKIEYLEDKIRCEIGEAQADE